MPSRSFRLKCDASTRILLALPALGTFLFGVNFLPPLQTCFLGVVMTLAASVTVCITPSLFFMVLGQGLLVGIDLTGRLGFLRNVG